MFLSFSAASLSVDSTNNPFKPSPSHCARFLAAQSFMEKGKSRKFSFLPGTEPALGSPVRQHCCFVFHTSKPPTPTPNKLLSSLDVTNWVSYPDKTCKIVFLYISIFESQFLHKRQYNKLNRSKYDLNLVSSLLLGEYRPNTCVRIFAKSTCQFPHFRLSVRTQVSARAYRPTDFREILYRGLSWKTIHKIQIWLTSCTLHKHPHRFYSLRRHKPP